MGSGGQGSGGMSQGPSPEAEGSQKEDEVRPSGGEEGDRAPFDATPLAPWFPMALIQHGTVAGLPQLVLAFEP